MPNLIELMTTENKIEIRIYPCSL